MIRWFGRELVGVWRSVRYDLGRRTSLSRQRTEVLHPEYDAYHQRPSRRGFVATVLAAVVTTVVGGVVGPYVAVARGLGAVLSAPPARPGLPPAAPRRP